MTSPATELARRLAEQAETVCRHYLSNGRRSGHYWSVGDVQNTPGQSLYVRLRGPSSGKGAAGKWTDAQTGEHGDLLDLIQLSCGLASLGDALDEAGRFLALPSHERRPATTAWTAKHFPAPSGSIEAARRLFGFSHPIAGTLAETYLRSRGLTTFGGTALRYHPAAYYRESRDAPRETWPALLGVVTDSAGAFRGVQRTYLDPKRGTKAPVGSPRRALGHLLGHAVRFGAASDTLAVGEGIETMLSLKEAIPALPVAAALSASHLAAFEWPSGLRRLYIARDNDPAGRRATETLQERAEAADIEVIELAPWRDDFNADLRRWSLAWLRERVTSQLAPEDRLRFAPSDAGRRPPA